MLKRPIPKAGWTRVAFGDVVRLSKARVADPEAAGIERFVGLEHIEPGDLRIRRWGDVADGTTFTTLFKPGQVLFGKRRAYQRKVAVADFEGVCSGDIYVLEPADDQLKPELLPFLCQSEAFFDHAVGTSAGSLSPRTNWDSLANFKFFLPPDQEQKRLVGILAASRNCVESMITLNQCLETLRLSLIFSFEERVSLTDMIPFRRVVQRIETGRSPSSSGEVAGENEFGVLKVSAVGNWSYVESENKVISERDFARSSEVKAGDFLATRANADPDSVGRTCVVESTRPGLMLSDKTWRIVLNETISPYSAAALGWTKSRVFRKHVRNQLNGTDAKNISQKAFLSAPFPPINDYFIELDRGIREIEQRRREALKRELLTIERHSRIIGEVFSQ